MTTNTPTDLKDFPEVHPRHGVPEPPPPRYTPSGKPKKRGFVWVLLLLIIAGVAAYRSYRMYASRAAGSSATLGAKISIVLPWSV